MGNTSPGDDQGRRSGATITVDDWGGRWERRRIVCGRTMGNRARRILDREIGEFGEKPSDRRTARTPA
jgi:hypothetical protein